MVNHKDEHVIYIKDLLFAVLYRWRTVLIVALALALLLGGYRGVSLWNSNTDSTVAQEDLEAYEHQKQTLALEVTRLEDRIDVFSTYITDSPFMALNPHSVCVTELHVYLEPMDARDVPSEGDSDPADAMLGAYRTLLLGNEALDTIATALDMEGMNMEGIVDVNCDLSTNLLTVIIRQAEQENTDAVLDTVKAAISDAQTAINEIMGAHKVSVLSSSVSLRNDVNLALLQSQKNDELLALKETLEARIADQNALVAPEMQPISQKQILMSVIKFGILGGLVGVFAVAVIVILVHLARTKVYSRRTLENQTGLHILGCIPSSKKRCGIDRWLRKTEGRCVEAPAHQGALIAARIRNLCGTEGALLLSGAGSADDRLPMLDALEAAGCTVIANGDLLRDAKTVSALGNCTGVVLIEQCGKSLYTAVGEAAAQAEAMGKPVLGCVLIDG